MYISPFTPSRTFTVRLLPPRLPGRMSGSTWLHSSSVKSLGYRSLLGAYRARFSIVHIGDLSTTQAAPGRLSLHHKRLIPFNMFPNRFSGENGSNTGSGRWTRIEDSWVVEQRVGWCAMRRGGEPWRGLLII